MIKITNGVNVFEVTKGAFESIYSAQGYKQLDTEEETVTVKVIEVKSSSAEGEVIETDHVEAAEEVQSGEESMFSDDDLKFCTEIVERPIGQWKKEDVKRFAEIKGIDLSAAKTFNDAKAIVKNSLS